MTCHIEVFAFSGGGRWSVSFSDMCFGRSAAVDSSGREFNRNRLIALMSAIVLEEVSLSF